MQSFFKFSFFFLFLSLIVVSCVKDEFDNPPVTGEDPDIAQEDIVTLEDVLDLYQAGNFIKVDMDKYVQAVVIADDASGSFYKTLVVQDENSDYGISILIDENNLSATYPIGKRVFVHLKNLWISDYEGLPQLGYGPFDDEGETAMAYIPGVLIKDILIGGQNGQFIQPAVVSSMNLLGGSRLNTLIQLDDVQFATSSLGGTYADPVLELSANHTLLDCNGNEITVRASGFAEFAGDEVAEGRGTLVAVYTIFRTTRQLVIRDLSDVQFDQERCSTSGIGGTKHNIADIRAAFNGTATTAPDGFIEGIVISDFANGNITGRNLVIQDESGGIAVRFDGNHSYGLNARVRVATTAMELSEFNGLLQLNNVPLASSESVGTGSMAATTASIAQIRQDFEKYESTLVTIVNPQVSGGTTFAGTLTVSDGSASIDLFTRNGASFANDAVPANVQRVTGIVGEFSTGNFSPQLSMRNRADVVGDGGSGGNEGLDETFDGNADNTPIDISQWINIATEGERTWQKKTFDGNGYAQATAFNDSNPAMETWLITPEVDAAKYGTLSFETAKAFYIHDGLTVWMTEAYTGDPATTNWTAVSATIAGSNNADHEWVPSGDVDISAMGSKARIAFKYIGNPSTGTTSYRVDNVVVK